ncbi:MAG: PrsW family intramembrane metalloprotease [Deltaproteobacteria bacterium]|nr:PrsW family intramembrane metalloprotease [Deltaproteobacteria bacterium]
MIVAITGISALVPSILLAWFFYSRDMRREPARAVWATFGLGVLSIVPTLLFALPIMAHVVPRFGHPLAVGPAEAFLAAALPEEFFKFSVLYWYARQRRWFDEPMDGVVYGAIASLGFATLENVMYCLQGNLLTAIMRAVTSVPGHAFWGAMMGYYVGVARFSPPAARAGLLRRALGWPILLHGLYDTGLLSLKAYGERGTEPVGAELAVVLALLLVSLATVIVSWIYGIRLTRRMRRAQRLALLGSGGDGAVGAAAQPTPVERALAAIWPVDAGAGDEPVPEDVRRASRPRASRPLAWLMLAGGGLLLLGGALMLLGSVLLAAKGKVASALVGGLISGVLPVVLALFLFSRGLRRMPQRVRVSLPPAPPAGPAGAAAPLPRAVPPEAAG